MNNFDGVEEPVFLSPQQKKGGRCQEKHEKEKRKKTRYSGGGKVPQVASPHTADRNTHICHANLLTDDDLALNHDKFYENPVKVAQDQHILTLLDISKPKRKSGTELMTKRDEKIGMSLSSIICSRKTTLTNFQFARQRSSKFLVSTVDFIYLSLTIIVTKRHVSDKLLRTRTVRCVGILVIGGSVD